VTEEFNTVMDDGVYERNYSFDPDTNIVTLHLNHLADDELSDVRQYDLATLPEYLSDLIFWLFYESNGHAKDCQELRDKLKLVDNLDMIQLKGYMTDARNKLNRVINSMTPNTIELDPMERMKPIIFKGD